MTVFRSKAYAPCCSCSRATEELQSLKKTTEAYFTVLAHIAIKFNDSVLNKIFYLLDLNILKVSLNVDRMLFKLKNMDT